MKASKIVNAFLAGALIGSIAALFMTPFSGKKMRRITKKKVGDAYTQTKTKLEPTIKELGKITVKFGEEAKVIANKLQDEALTTGKTIFEKIKPSVKQTSDNSQELESKDRTSFNGYNSSDPASESRSNNL